MKLIIGFIIAPLAASLIYTFWVVGGFDKYYRVFPIVFSVALGQAILFAGPAYYWLKLKGYLHARHIILASVFVTVTPWLILQLISGLEHQTLKTGGKVLIENGDFTIHWWARYFWSMVKLSFCGIVAGLVFNLIMNTTLPNKPKA